ncbi:hypothetical protein AX14_005316 [Amanita brunnescens Koide BX004]|nr:hypothetical protein AX14_005316 [Amanita brunnescens Koide BX004]
MPTSVGTFTCSNNDFNGNFYPEGYAQTLRGIFNGRIPQFAVPTATITYDSLRDFRGKYTVYSLPPSFVGPDTVDISFMNDIDHSVMHLTGKLASPVDKRYPIIGYGSWDTWNAD